MKTKTVFVSISVFLYLFLPLPSAQAETLPPITISEIQIAGAKADDEFIELYNPTDGDINLSDWSIRRKTKSDVTIKGTSVKTFGSSNAIPAHGYFLWTNTNSVYATLADVTTTAGLTNDNSLALYSNDTPVDVFTWGSGHILPFAPSAFPNPEPEKSFARDKDSLAWSLISQPTPMNSSSEILLPQETPPPTPTPPPDPVLLPPPPAPIPPTPIIRTVRMSEVFPNPKAKSETGEFIELYNFGVEPADISGWILRDATKTGKYIFPDGTLMAAATYLTVTDQSFKLSLNNSNETISLFDNVDTLIDSVHYATTKEDISLNFLDGKWRGGKPTPGATNILNNLPETKERVPQKGYHGMAVDFDAQGKDTDHDTLKYTWDFGDGHKSYKEKTSHTYEKNGTYAVTLKTTDGKDDTLETFSLKIQDFPHPEVRITSLLPNPTGNDTDSEWIIIENREKKTVNLKDFSIATGWKTLANHPIRGDFLIGPKSEAKLTRAFSLFILPNQKGKIELRAPDGKVLQEIEYKLEKSISEDVIYQKKKGEKWKFEETSQKNIPSLDTSEERDEAPETLPEKNALDETAPEEDVSNAMDIENTAEVLGVSDERPQLSLDPLRPKPEDILAYGTRVRIPRTLTLTHSAQKEIALLPKAKYTPLSLAARLASHINTSLNELFNNSKER